MTDTGTAAAVKGIRDGTRPLVKLPSHTYKKKHQDNKGACDDVQSLGCVTSCQTGSTRYSIRVKV